jgi:hypothetical protein
MQSMQLAHIYSQLKRQAACAAGCLSNSTSLHLYLAHGNTHALLVHTRLCVHTCRACSAHHWCLLVYTARMLECTLPRVLAAMPISLGTSKFLVDLTQEVAKPAPTEPGCWRDLYEVGRPGAG